MLAPFAVDAPKIEPIEETPVDTAAHDATPVVPSIVNTWPSVPFVLG